MAGRGPIKAEIQQQWKVTSGGFWPPPDDVRDRGHRGRGSHERLGESQMCRPAGAMGQMCTM